MRLGVKQDRGGHHWRHLVDAELQQRRIRRGFHFFLRVTAIVRSSIGGKLAFPVPGLGQYREVAKRVHLGTLGTWLAADNLFAVERMARARDTHRWAVPLA